MPLGEGAAAGFLGSNGVVEVALGSSAAGRRFTGTMVVTLVGDGG